MCVRECKQIYTVKNFMTTLLLNETLVKFPLLSDGSERNSLSLILSKLASVMYTAQMRLSLSLTRPFHSSHSRWLAHFYYYRESQTIHFIYSHTYIFNINISPTGSRQESQIRHFTLLSLPFRAPLTVALTRSLSLVSRKKA